MSARGSVVVNSELKLLRNRSSQVADTFIEDLESEYQHAAIGVVS